jgi:8-oxo-dGTP diphosphatase
MINQKVLEIRKKAEEKGIKRFSTGAAIMKNNKVLMVKRKMTDSNPGIYELPGGKVEEKEDIIEGAKREVFEETSLKPKQIIAVLPGFEYYSSNHNKTRQFNFLMEIENGKIVLSEHDKYIWVNKNKFKKLNITPEMREVLKFIFKK